MTPARALLTLTVIAAIAWQWFVRIPPDQSARLEQPKIATAPKAPNPAEPEESADAPPKNRPDEPLTDKFSLASAGEYLDKASVHWTATKKCFTCHTNYAYLMARPAIGGDDSAHRQVRAALEQLVV